MNADWYQVPRPNDVSERRYQVPRPNDVSEPRYQVPRPNDVSERRYLVPISADDDGQAVSEYVLILALFFGLYVAGTTVPPLQKATAELFNAFTTLTNSYDLILSLPFP